MSYTFNGTESEAAVRGHMIDQDMDNGFSGAEAEKRASEGRNLDDSLVDRNAEAAHLTEARKHNLSPKAYLDTYSGPNYGLDPKVVVVGEDEEEKRALAATIHEALRLDASFRKEMKDYLASGKKITVSAPEADPYAKQGGTLKGTYAVKADTAALIAKDYMNRSQYAGGIVIDLDEGNPGYISGPGKTVAKTAAGEKVRVPMTGIEAVIHELEHVIHDAWNNKDDWSDPTAVFGPGETFVPNAHFNRVNEIIGGIRDLNLQNVNIGPNRSEYPPVALDLDGDGIELIDLEHSSAVFDLDGDGYLEATGWVDKDDGMLVIDLDSSGRIDKPEELAIGLQTIEADTDLQAVAALYDTNKDGFLDALDNDYDKFQVWRDVNGDGYSDVGELVSLSAAGITRLSLVSDEQAVEVGSNRITGFSYYVAAGGAIRATADLQLAADDLGFKMAWDGEELVAHIEGLGGLLMSGGSQSLHVDLGQAGLIAALGSSANDKIVAGTAASNAGVVMGGAEGDDTLVGGSGTDWIDGGDGADQLDGGGGDDMLFIDDADTLTGGSGHDVARVVGDAAVELNLANAQVEETYGGPSSDRLDAGELEADGATLRGAEGADTLIGSARNDVLQGDQDIDLILGGGGDDVIISDGIDAIDGGDGFDTLVISSDNGSVELDVAEWNLESVIASAGSDRIRSGAALGVSFLGLSGNDFLSGSDATDLLHGGEDDDVVAGKGGDDIFVYNRGDRHDEVRDRYVIEAQIPQIADYYYTLSGSFNYTTYYKEYYGKNNDQWKWSPTSGTKNYSVEAYDYDVTVTPESLHLDGGDDVLAFGDGITQADLVWKFDGNDLIIGLKDPADPNKPFEELTDTIRLRNWLDERDRVETIKFADETELSIAALVGSIPVALVYATIQGTSGSDTQAGGIGSDSIIGSEGNDELTGDDGYDRLEGGKGNDTYKFSKGDGSDEILDQHRDLVTTVDYETHDPEVLVGYSYTNSNGNPSTGYKDVAPPRDRTITTSEWVEANGGSDTLIFGPGIAVEDIAVQIRGDDLIIAIRDPNNPDQQFEALTDRIRVIDWSDPNNRIEFFQFADGTIIDVSQFIGGYSGDGGDQILVGSNLGDWLSGGAGDDWIGGGGSGDILIGNSGNDWLWGGTGTDTLVGGEAVDNKDVDTASYVTSDAGVTVDLTNNENNKGGDAEGDKLYGIENLLGSAGADTLTGDASDNKIEGWLGADSIGGGGGTDTVSYASSAAGVTVVLNTSSNSGGDATGDTLSGFENIEGSAFSDNLTGDGGNNRIEGGAGADTIAGGSGTDTAAYTTSAAGVTVDLSNNANNKGGDAEGDSLSSIENLAGSEFADSLTGNGSANKLESDDGDDTLKGGAGADTLDGGTGTDAISYAGSGAGVTVNLQALTASGGDAAGDVIASTLINGKSVSTIENIIGSALADSLTGADADSVTGATGDNLLEGGTGADTIAGGTGIDTARYWGDQFTSTGVTVDLLNNANNAGADAQGDSLSGIENLVGSAFNDVLTGSALANLLEGGAGDDSIKGDSGDDTLKGGTGSDTLEGGSGSDAVDYGDALAGVTATIFEDTVSGYGSASGGSANDKLKGIEHIIGSAFSDTLSGNDLDNKVEGRAGNDRLDGGVGADTLTGGTGNDTFIVDDASDVVLENELEGFDTVESSVTYTLGATLENLTLTGTGTINGVGNSANNTLTGNLAANRLEGLDGDDTIDGGIGNDTLIGGAGNDTYTVDGTGDLIDEGDGKGGDAGGTELVQSSITYMLTSYVDNLTLTGTESIDGTGNTLANLITGNEGSNVLSGADGNDTLIGGGGVDAFKGGNGTDTVSYAYSSSGIAVDLAAGVGTSGDAKGETFDSIENIVGSAFADSLTGTNADTASGASGDNLFDAGAGADTIAGGTGTDTVTYAASAAAVSIDLLNNANNKEGDAEGDSLSGIENLVGSGSDDTLSGNTAANLLEGGAGDDSLKGDVGADTMLGGAGDDTYVVDNTGDIVTENKNEGTDSVESSVGFKLGTDIEHLTLTGAAAAFGTGNTLDNRITGNSASNQLTGNEGDDTLLGGGGGDQISGGAGTDTASYAGSNAGVTVNLKDNTASGGDAQGDSISGIENLVGSSKNDSLTGDDAYYVSGGLGNRLDGGAGNDTLAAGLGDDVYVVETTGDVVTEKLDEGTDTVEFASTTDTSTYTLPDYVENLTLTGTANINGTGNGLNNTIKGNSGANVLDGGTGVDTLKGAAGNDTYVVDDAGDKVVESQAGGTDTVTTGLTWTLGDYVENLTLTGSDSVSGYGNTLANAVTGNTAANLLVGYAGSDTLKGGAGVDTLQGGEGLDTASYEGSAAVTVNLTTGTNTGGDAAGDVLSGIENLIGSANADSLTGDSANNRLDGGSGNDTLAGGAGNDTYVVDVAGDSVTENANAGIDTIEFAAGFTGTSYTLSPNLENVTVKSATSIAITGNTAENQLIGGTGSDTLIGGSGADTLTGGKGDDSYDVDSTVDIVVELADEGTDSVSSAVTHTLGANLENLTLTGSSGIEGTGNTLANAITGNSGANKLSGLGGDDTLKGGAGADTLDGCIGNDTASYAGSSAGVTVDLTVSGAQTSTGDASGDALTSVENLIGSGLNDKLTGTADNNRLDGGAGTDTLVGGDGDDSYVVGAAGDVVTEAANEGTDTVEASVTFSLASLAEIENLTLTGTGAINGTGNAGANLITGNSGTNTLDGGLGDDTLLGGAGADTLDGGSGLGDTASYANTATAVNVNLNTGAASGGDAQGDTFSNIENLIGGAGSDTLTGSSGANRLDGGRNADSLAGGVGDDVYVVDDADADGAGSDLGDVVTENASEGTDTVESSVNWTLGANLEKLVLTGTADLSGTGNSLTNTITGNSGNNRLDGGADADTLIGGAGDDTYVVDGTDAITENADEGIDTVESSATYNLAAIANVENLTLTGSSAINGTGNALANLITGNTGANSLAGGDGDDTLQGGLGADKLDGGNGTDIASYAGSSGAVTVDLGTGTASGGDATGDTFVAIEGLIGSGLADNLTGSTGNNTIEGGADADTLAGGSGTDTASYAGSAFGVTVDLSNNANNAGGDATGDSLSGFENLLGSANADVLTGDGSANKLEGGAGNDTLTGNAGTDTLAGGTGNDTYVVDSTSDVITENAGEGRDTVQTSVSYTLGAEVENLTLTGTGAVTGTGNALDNVIIGNTGNNTLTSGAGGDRLDGGAGADSLSGGTGDDTYVIDNAGDTIAESANEGVDTVETTVSHTLGSNVENLVIRNGTGVSGTGNALDNSLFGNTGNDTLAGQAGADRLDGGAGTDSMSGGTGDDTYVVDNASDTVNELSGEGTDTVQAWVTHTLTGNVENLVLMGTADLAGTGNSLANTLTGNAGKNTLDGGTGTDTLAGGSGDDTYVIDSSGDVVAENVAGGVDLVQSKVTYTLGAEVEHLTLTDADAINGTGNALNNKIIGNSAANVLTGNDGNDTLSGDGDTAVGGADTLVGGKGDDVYIVDHSSDVITEAAGEGTDRVEIELSGTYDMATKAANVENATLLGTSNSGITGNSANNVLVGNSGANTLSGGVGDDWLDGGAGNDTLAGGTGNDVFVVEGTGDSVSENASEGTDTVISSSSYALGANLENLILAGSGHLTGTGNALANVITGNSGNNRLDGGAGVDTMIGGAGDDTFVVDNSQDNIVEQLLDGTDTVEATSSYTLSVALENLKLLGDAAIDGTGNMSDNLITGNVAANTLKGDFGNDTIVGGYGADTIDGGSGFDVVSYAGSADAVNADIGGTSTGGDADGDKLTHIEDLIGSDFNDNLKGDNSDNRLDGGAGADTLAGSAGNDFYVLDDTADSVSETSGNGFDIVETSFTYTLSTYLEGLFLTGAEAVDGTGNASDNLIVGNLAANKLDGSTGNDFLEGRGGNDTLIGGGNDDTVIGGTGADSLDGGAGTDTLTYAGSAAGVEIDLAANSAKGGDAEGDTLASGTFENLTGSAWNDTLTGTSTANTLDGGEGVDSLTGGAGNDTYIVDHSLDVVVEASAAGTDEVESSASYVLSDNIEKLTLTGTASIWGTGNSLANTITGNDGDNRLDGGAGNDTMVGGKGDDTYIVDSASDAITENTGNGYDTVFASVTYSAWYDYVEKTVLTGTGNINATGNDLENTLIGNTGNNSLVGGDGDDTLIGGAGNDTLNGGNHYDAASYADSTAAVSATLNGASGTASDGFGGTDSFVYIDNLIGSSYNDTLTGDTTGNIIEGGAGADSLNGGTGTDTLSYAGSQAAVTVDLSTNTVSGGDAQGDSVSSFENALGSSFNDTLTGSSAANKLEGGDGNDTLNGGAGNDTMVGGTGDDSYTLDSASDVITESAEEGTDTATTSVTWTMDAEVENVILGGNANINATGNAVNNLMTGNSGNNSLSGAAGNDTLEGKDGIDSLAGSTGDDLYIVDSTTDVITESAGVNYGNDTVQSSVTLTLAANVENLTLTGTSAINGTGNTLDNAIIGNVGNNSLSGSDGNDRLDGSGGTDTLIGGKGNDTFVVDTTTDTITENASEGTDVVESSVTFSLAALTNVENLTLAGTAAINGTGNALANTITGNSGNNSLTGDAGDDRLDGSAGADTLTGGDGNDTYVVDSSGDAVSETGTGTDTVESAISFTLGANLDKLTLTGTANIDGTGNTLANTLTGNDGNNILDGQAGADTMSGGLGDDTYRLDNTGDSVTESASQGIDTVELLSGFTSYTLGSNLENLTVVQATAVNVTGNTLDNRLTGSAGNDTLSASSGNDTVTGGAGSDSLVGSTGTDTVSYAGSGAGVTVNLTVTGAQTSAGEASGDTLSGFENVIGSNYADNLTGDSNANRLDGGAGADTLAGGTGNDTYVVDDIDTDGAGADTGDVVTEGASAGTDTVEFYGQEGWTYTLSANVEKLTLMGSGNVNATGNTLANTLTGNSGDNVLDGGTGSDTMVGGAGDDSYYVDVAGDSITESAGGGVDTEYSLVTETLGTNLEHLTLLGSSAINGTGNGLNNRITGNTGNNSLNGSTGDDTLIGGAGNDTLTGGTGTDTASYAPVSAAVTVSLATNTSSGDGTDTLSGIENVIGGSGNDTITGDANANRLDGGGGADSLTGGAGNDEYVVDNTGDVVLESASAGTDTVEITDAFNGTSYTLSAEVEHLTITGSGAINATGNVLNNRIAGNSGNNSLDGGSGNDILSGGAGTDTVLGGAGNDTYEFGRGSETDLVDNKGTGSGQTDVVLFGSEIDVDQLWFTRNGTDLEISIIGTNDTLTVDEWFTEDNGQYVRNEDNQVDEFHTDDGQVLLASSVQQLIDAMAAFDAPPQGFTELSPFVRDQLTPVLAATWHQSAA